jgi:transcriptional regulator
MPRWATNYRELWQTNPVYTPAPFAENRIGVLQEFIRQHLLATLVSCGSSGPEATHVPVVLHTDQGTSGILRCHLARANDHWKDLQSLPAVLAIFHGTDHYITPSWYPTKQEHGKVVPTWNYVAVHVRGRARLFEDQSELIEHLRTLTDQNEQVFAQPWSVADAPQNYIDSLTKAIVGVEIAIDKIEGKCKASQNQPQSNQAGTVAGLNRLNSPESLRMAQLVAQRGLK